MASKAETIINGSCIPSQSNCASLFTDNVHAYLPKLCTLIYRSCVLVFTEGCVFLIANLCVLLFTDHNLFGSYVRGVADNRSDIDILVDLDYSQKIGLQFYSNET